MGLEIEMAKHAPAYPTTRHCSERGDEWQETEPGLTKRELIAAMAMQSLGFPAEWLTDETGRTQVRIREEYPRLAIEYADALLAALEQQA